MECINLYMLKPEASEPQREIGVLGITMNIAIAGILEIQDKK